MNHTLDRPDEYMEKPNALGPNPREAKELAEAECWFADYVDEDIISRMRSVYDEVLDEEARKDDWG